jgi:hypothetical protein
MIVALVVLIIINAITWSAIGALQGRVERLTACVERLQLGHGAPGVPISAVNLMRRD